MKVSDIENRNCSLFWQDVSVLRNRKISWKWKSVAKIKQFKQPTGSYFGISDGVRGVWSVPSLPSSSTLGADHTNEFWHKNALFFRLSSTLKCPKTLMKTEAFPNGFERETFQKHVVLKTLRFQCDQVKTEVLENGYEKSVTYCRFYQRVSAFFSVDDR